MMVITKVLKRTTGEDNKKTEMYEYFLIVFRDISFWYQYRFMTANRSVRTGLTASAVISVSIWYYQKYHYDAFVLNLD